MRRDFLIENLSKGSFVIKSEKDYYPKERELISLFPFINPYEFKRFSEKLSLGKGIQDVSAYNRMLLSPSNLREMFLYRTDSEDEKKEIISYFQLVDEVYRFRDEKVKNIEDSIKRFFSCLRTEVDLDDQMLGFIRGANEFFYIPKGKYEIEVLSVDEYLSDIIDDTDKKILTEHFQKERWIRFLKSNDVKFIIVSHHEEDKLETYKFMFCNVMMFCNKKTYKISMFINPYSRSLFSPMLWLIFIRELTGIDFMTSPELFYIPQIFYREEHKILNKFEFDVISPYLYQFGGIIGRIPGIMVGNNIRYPEYIKRAERKLRKGQGDVYNSAVLVIKCPTCGRYITEDNLIDNVEIAYPYLIDAYKEFANESSEIQYIYATFCKRCFPEVFRKYFQETIKRGLGQDSVVLSLIHISEPTRRLIIVLVLRVLSVFLMDLNYSYTSTVSTERRW